ncbi:MAG: PilZ domain-containing protein [Candidatus Omnitrophota bacterium]|nr:PilZ domain-containing protein [Candidatus Omnitrophota bacterium]
MDTDKRQSMRFNAPLKLELEKGDNEFIPGSLENFSRQGLEAVFNSFDFAPNSSVSLRVQEPNKDSYAALNAEVVWKKEVEGRWLVGMKLKEMSNWVKTEILEYGFNAWRKSHKISQ